jgi:LysR family glycine cleavage system transcriptional activator
MSRLPLQLLPTFRTVARGSNLRAAAAELNLTHSAVSQQIRLLETQLGFALFERRGRRLVINAAGETLLAVVEPALAQLDDGVRAAAATASGAARRIRITLLPSFAQRWLLPRIGRWRERHPDIGIELSTSQQLEDLLGDSFDVALRQGAGYWRGLEAEPLIESPLIAVGSPDAARRLLGREAATLAAEPLLGSATLWQRWFADAGLRVRINPVADFSDAGLMLQAAEQNIGIALGRELYVADALRDGRLVRLSSQELPDEQAYAFWLVYRPGLRHWPPLAALRTWLADELARSQREIALLGRSPLRTVAGTSPAARTGSRSRASSAPAKAARAKRRA